MKAACTGILSLAMAVTIIAADAPKPIDVKVTRPSRGDIYRFVTLPGTIKADQEATLYAKVGGYLTALKVDKGDAVKAGQLLGEIEVPELLAERIKYQAEVKVAQADFQRINAAQKKAPDLITPQSVDEARGRLDIAKANLERTETLLRYARLTAPFAGIVTARYVDSGAFIPAATSGSAARNAAVVTIADFSTVRVQVPVPAAEASRVQVGQPVSLSVGGVDGQTFKGSVSRHSYALDENTQSLLVEADLPNPEHQLRPGMFASVKIGVDHHSNVLGVPSEAVLMEKSGASVFLAEGGKAKKTAVKVGFNDGLRTEILSGLSGTEAVVVLGKTVLADGAAINATEGK